MEAEKKALEVEKRKKVKSAEEKLWQECTALGRKVDGMVTHSESIVLQSSDKDNDWWWARGEKVAALQEAIDIAKPCLLKWESSVRTSTLAYLVKKQWSEIELYLVKANGKYTRKPAQSPIDP